MCLYRKKTNNKTAKIAYWFKTMRDQLTNSPTASVILLIYNNKADLAECISSILGQSGVTFEVIVVDNGSSDGGPDYVRATYPGIRIIETGANLGYAEGNNVGLREAKGKFVVIVNPDTVVGQNWLSELIKPLKKDPAIAITTSKILMHSDKYLINTCANHSHFTGLNFCSGLNKPSSSFLKPVEVGAMSGCSFAARKDVLAESGGLDPDFFLYLEDDDLSWRVRLLGYRIVLVPSSVIYHKYQLNITPAKEFYLERNRYQLLLKNYRFKTLLLISPALLMAEVLTSGHALLNGPAYFHSKLKACWWVLANAPGIVKKRHAVQTSRKVTDRELIRLLEWRIPFEQMVRNRYMKRLLELTFNSSFKLYFAALNRIV